MNNAKKVAASFVVCAAVFSASTFAVTENNKTIKSVAIQTNGQAYATFTTPLTTNCQFGLLYIGSPSLDTTKGMLALLLSAQATDKHVDRIDYTVDTNGACNATIVEVGQ